MTFLLKLVLLVSLLSLFRTTWSSSSDYGQNPQHEFGSVSVNPGPPPIPYWTLEGAAVAFEEYVRLTPDRQSQNGAIWNTEPNHFGNWEILFKVLIHGQGSLGADGMGFWYVTQKQSGSFFGVTELFQGLGVVIDTYDNEGKGYHPRLMVLVNDGTKHYEHQHDAQGQHQAGSVELGGCSVLLRNLVRPTFVKVSYYNRELTVETDVGSTGKWTKCASAVNVYLATMGYFGFTGTTGQLADNHDVYGFSIKNLDPNAHSLESYGHKKTNTIEYLSRINYELSFGSEVQNVDFQIEHIQSTLRRIDGVLNRIPTQAQGDYQTVLNEVKSSLKQISHTYKAADNQSSSILTILWYLVLLLLVLAVVYFGFIIYRVFIKNRASQHLY